MSQGETAAGRGRGLYQAGVAEALTFADVEYGGFAFSGVDQSPVQIVS